MAVRKQSKATTFRKYLTLVLIGLTILFIALLLFINILPFKYLIVIVFLIIILEFLLIRQLFKKKKHYKIWPLFITLLACFLLIIVIIYEFTTAGFLNRLGLCDIKTYNYVVLTLKEDKYKKIKELKNHQVVLVANDDETKKMVEKKIKTEVSINDSIEDAISLLDNNKIDGLILEQSFYDILKEENNLVLQKVNILDEFSVDIVKKIDRNEVNIAKKPFNILITGIDTTGSVNSVARSDVNILATVNPKTNQVVLTAIPRDYYVSIKKGAIKDKLTHSGIYGIDSTIYAVENLLDVDINYYVKVNFSSVVNIIDVIGEVTVYSDTSFKSGTYDFNEKSYYFKEGENTLNGKEALAFARERKAFLDGDRRRGVHQMALIEAMANKLLEPKTIIKYNSILEELSDSFVTNLSHDNISKLIKKQINSNDKWEFINVSVTGKDSYEKTYSYKNSTSYVMIPDEDSVDDAKDKIKEIYNNK